MRFTSTKVLIGGAALLGLALSVGTAQAQLSKDEVKCERAITKETSKYFAATMKIKNKCENSILKGKFAGPCPDLKSAEKLAKVEVKYAAGVAKKCGGDDKLCSGGDDIALSNLGYGATCPELQGQCGAIAIGPGCAGLSDCLKCLADEGVSEIIEINYDALISTDPKLQKPINKCQQEIGKAATKWAIAKSKLMQKCQDGRSNSKHNNDCPDPGDGKALPKIQAAEGKKIAAICKKCGGDDKACDQTVTSVSGGPAVPGSGNSDDFTAADIGFPSSCPSVTIPGGLDCSTIGGGTITTLADVIACVDCIAEYKVDCIDAGAIPRFETYPSECGAGPAFPTPTPTATATPTPSPATPTPTATSTPGVLCGNGVLDGGEVCDPAAASPDNECPNVNGALFPCNVDCTCDCPGTIEFTGNASSLDSLLDPGWTGIAHDSALISDGTITVAITGCDNAGRPCGECSFAGPIVNDGAGAGDIDSQRCVGNTSIHCTSDGDCGGSGPCRFFFGSNLPLSAGGVATCVTNAVEGTIVGTANVESGESASVANLISRVFTGITTDQPCPQCVGDATPNDNVLGGICNGGDRNGLACDTNGTSPVAAFGDTSLDCPPAAGAQIASLPINLSNSTDQEAKTLSADSPNCRALGHTTFKCACDTCNNAAATPCSTNADCVAVGATVCGGRRCVGGTNNGAPCLLNSECPGGGLCSFPGATTATNSCSDAVCTPTGGNEGECDAGPIDQNCDFPEQYAGCTQNSDCPQTNNCVSKLRECFTDNGAIGNAIVADGVEDTPVNDTSEPTLASVFCIGPTGSSSVNNVAGLPGPGRLTLNGLALGLP